MRIVLFLKSSCRMKRPPTHHAYDSSPSVFYSERGGHHLDGSFVPQLRGSHSGDEEPTGAISEKRARRLDVWSSAESVARRVSGEKPP
jgi:hypothetical protein